MLLIYSCLQFFIANKIPQEWLGGDGTQVETNYFGKGNITTYDRATYVPVAAPQNTFHTYSIDWTASAIKWSIDGNVIRTLAYGDANGGKNYPQTPMQVKMGNWVGGSSTAPEGTVQWAGGLTDFKNAPFTMNVKSVTIQDYSTGGSQYVYSDMSGSWQSIKADGTSGGSSSSGSSSSSSPSAASSATKSSAASSSTISATSNLTTTSSTLSTVTTAPVASGGLGGGAVTQSVSAVTTTSAATTKANGNAGATLKVGSSAVILMGMGLGYLFL
jgi:beta-glucanase (GH16 family)